MKLLSAEEVKTEKQKGDEELAERSKRLKEGAISAAKGLNETRAYCEAEKARLEQNLREFEIVASIKKAALAQEIATLESRKRDALKPIHEQRKEAENRLKEAEEAEGRVAIYRATVDDDRKNLKRDSDALSEREKAFMAKDPALHSREKKLLEEKEDFERHVRAKEWQMRGDKERLRKYFEEEDAKHKK